MTESINAPAGAPVEVTQAQRRFLEACRERELYWVQKALSDGMDPNAPILMPSTNPRRQSDVGAREAWAVTPIVWAAQTGRVDILQAVIDAGAVPAKAVGATRITPLMSCVMSRESTLICQALIDAGDDVNAVDKNGVSVFLRAAALGSERMLQLLEDNGARVDTTTPDGRTAFHMAFDSSGCVRWLAQRIPQMMDRQDPQGCTALHLAALNDDYHCSRLLMELGADLSVRDNADRLAEDIARAKGRAELAGEMQAMRLAKEAFSIIRSVRNATNTSNAWCGAGGAGSTGRA